MSAPIPQPAKHTLMLEADAQNLVLAGIVGRMENSSDDLSTDDYVKFANIIVNFQKLHIAAHKANTYAERAFARTNAADPRFGKPTKREDDLEAPYGRKKDGTPYTPTEYRESLQEAVNEIYGVNLDDSLIHPERYTNNPTANNAPMLDANPQSGIPNPQSPANVPREGEAPVEPQQPTRTSPSVESITQSAIANPKSAIAPPTITPPAYFRTDALPRSAPVNSNPTTKQACTPSNPADDISNEDTS